MKKTIIASVLAVCFMVGNFAIAADQETDRRDVFAQSFEQLIKNAEQGLAKPAVQETFSKGNNETETFIKFAIASVAVPATTTSTATTNCNLGIKVWFQLENGTCFNPVKRKMGAKEKFYVHVQAAVPVYVSLFQNYPDSRPESKQVYPDTRYPDSFKAIQPGQSTRLPVLFEMDDDTRDEIMSMVVVRADAPQIQSTLSTQAVSTVTSSNTGTTVVTAQATATTAGTMKNINDTVTKGDEKDSKFIISGPAQTVATTSTVPNDVAFYMFGAGFVGQWQLTLKK